MSRGREDQAAALDDLEPYETDDEFIESVKHLLPAAALVGGPADPWRAVWCPTWPGQCSCSDDSKCAQNRMEPEAGQ